MKYIIAGALLFLLLTKTSFADVTFEGIRQEDQAALREVFPNLDKKPNPALLDEAVRWLALREIYSKIEVLSNDDTNFLIKGKIQKRLSNAILNGIRGIDEIDAYNVIKLREGSRIEQKQIFESVQDLQELYGRSGYFNPNIRTSIKESDTGEVVVTFNISENKPCIIRSITIESENKELSKQSQIITKSKIKKYFSEKNIADLEFDLNKYLQENRYLNARIQQKNARYNADKTEAHLTYAVTDPFSYYVQAEGNKYFSRGDILRSIDLDNFDRTGLNPSAEIAERVRKKYLSDGFAYAKVKFSSSEDLKEYTKRVDLMIDEGPKIIIKKIEVVGRLTRPAEYYSEFIENNSTESIDDHLYVREDLELGYKNLITELNNQGLLQARIQSARAEFDELKKQVKIIVLLEEGPLTTIRSISFVGATAFPENELLKTLELKPNEPLSLNKLENGIERIKSKYTSSGYIEMSVENENDKIVYYDTKASTATLQLKLREGPKVYIREILVEGNSFTKSNVVKRGADLEPGELLTPERIEEATNRLINLKLFSQVEIKTLEANTGVSKRTIIIAVTERNPGIFKIGAGVTNKRELTVRGYTGISYDNLYGTGRAVGLNLSGESNVVGSNYPEYDINASFLEPFAFGSKFRARFNIGREEKVEAELNNGDILRIRATNRLSLFTERDISSRVRFSWNTWTYESVEIFFDPRSNGTDLGKKEQIATIGPLLDVDYRDHPLLTTKGVFFRLETDYSSPNLGSSDGIEFIRSQGTVSIYNRIWGKSTIWANSIRGGFENNLSSDDDSGIPESYAFFLGGYTTIRGFSGIDGDRIPNTDNLPKDQSGRVKIPSESSYYLVKSEIRFPVYGMLGGAIFYDAGQVLVQGLSTESQNAFNKTNPLRQAGGIAIRINTPVVPISIDYGRKFNHKSEKSEDQLHVSIGVF